LISNGFVNNDFGWVIGATVTRITGEELLDAVFSARFVLGYKQDRFWGFNRATLFLRGSKYRNLRVSKINTGT
jgi:hypothetical protein